MSALRVVDDVFASEITPDFGTFWELYPRKVARKAAERAFARVVKADYQELFAGLLLWRREWLRRGEMEFVPHAATWLNGERWTDELPTPPTATASAHVAFSASAEKTPRGELTDEIKAKIRRALGK